LSSCAAPPGPSAPSVAASTPRAPAAPAPDPNAPIISPFVQDVLREAAADPIAALPVQAPPVRLAGTWSGEILRRIGALALRAGAESSEGSESNELLVNYYQFIWWAPPLIAMSGGEADLRRRLTDPSEATKVAALCDTYRRTDDYSDRLSCGQSAVRTLAQAQLRLALGDRQAAETLYGQATTALPIGGGAVKCNHDLEHFPQAVDSDCVWFLEQRAAYQGLTGRADDFVATMKTALSFPPKTRGWDREELPNDDTGGWTYTLMRASGKLRAFGVVADQMTTERLLTLWDTSGQLFEEIDRQAASPAGHANAVNLLAIAARLSTRELGTTAGNRLPLRLALDCRAAEIRALSPAGKEQVAGMLAEMVDRYVSNDGEYFSAYLCLYELADKLGQADQRARVLAHVEHYRQSQIAKVQADARNYSGEHEDVSDHAAALASIVAWPWLRFLADEATLRDGIVAALDQSKSAPMKALDYKNLMNIVLWVQMYQPH
jgi:hypothetical protein